MNALPAEVYTASQARAMDRHAIERSGIAGYTLMRRAGAAALAVLRRRWPQAASVSVLCGAGNNGGDGYVLARLARAAGLTVRVAALADPQRLQRDAGRAHADFRAAGGRAESFDAAVLAGADVVVDALLGTGVDRPVAGPLRDCIEAINASGRPVLALDLPSGLDADTGLMLGAAVRASCTITFVALKSGLYLGVAPEHAGAIEFDGLELPASARDEQAPVMRRIEESVLGEVLPRRRRSAHKGEHGRVLIVGGLAMAGAARLAGEAALRTGAGLVHVATTVPSAAAIVAGQPELICHGLRAASGVAPLAQGADAMAVGPGLGLDRRAQRFFEAATATDRPLVVDADALSLLAKKPRRCARWILTPHAGEAGRLLGTDAGAVQRDRLGSVRAIAARHGGICVLKGANTLVHGDAIGTYVCDRGNPGMATAGTGDVLTGVLVALLAGGADAGQSATAGVLLHATAGDRAARAGERGLIAGDLVGELHQLVNEPWN